jgi:hypothetical protein
MMETRMRSTPTGRVNASVLVGNLFEGEDAGGAEKEEARR